MSKCNACDVVFNEEQAKIEWLIKEVSHSSLLSLIYLVITNELRTTTEFELE